VRTLGHHVMHENGVFRRKFHPNHEKGGKPRGKGAHKKKGLLVLAPEKGGETLIGANTREKNAKREGAELQGEGQEVGSGPWIKRQTTYRGDLERTAKEGSRDQRKKSPYDTWCQSEIKKK